MSTILVYDPEGRAEQALLPLAPGRADWRGAKVGVLDNAKQHAGEVMALVADRLGERFGGLTVVTARKESAAVPATPEQLAAMKECDLVLTGTGD